MPLSPSIKEIFEMQQTVFIYAGSKDLRTSPFGLLRLARFVAFIVSSLISISYLSPVLLSTIDKESFGTNLDSWSVSDVT